LKAKTLFASIPKKNAGQGEEARSRLTAAPPQKPSPITSDQMPNQRKIASKNITMRSEGESKAKSLEQTTKE